MLKSRSHSLVWLLALSALFLLACETTNLIGGSAQRRPTSRASGSANPTRDPAAPFDFMTLDQPRCSAGDNSASIVNGTATLDGFPAVGQVVQASSEPGGDPMPGEPAQVGDDGNFQVTFICGGAACNGSYWLWLVDEDSQQISPYIEYIFDDQCRRGTVNFGNP